MGVYEADRHPVLALEQDLLRERLAAGRPSLGICLGAQLLAAAAGATVAPGIHGRVVGVAPVRAVPVALESPWLRGAPPAFDVVHWHGDTFAPVPGQPLFTAEPYAAQGFRVGRSVGLQFHPELGPDELRTWVALEGDALRAAGHDPEALLTTGLPRLQRSLPALDRLLASLAREARAAVQGA